MRHTPLPRDRDRFKQMRDCTPEEVEAIYRFVKGSHPSNVPEDLGEAWWGFIHNRKGVLCATLFSGYLL